MLYEFIAVNRDEIVRRCRAKVASRTVPPPTEAEIDFGVPVFLDQLGDALRNGQISSPEIGRSGVQHGHNLLRLGFTVSQVVHDYGDICQAITELAVETNAPISADDFRTLNRCLDDAIAGAVTQYTRERQQSDEHEVAQGAQRLGFFAHELRNLINTAIVAFDVLKTGNVGVGGSTGSVLHRSLIGLHGLVNRSLAEVRLTQGVQNREPLALSAFIDDIAAAAALEAEARDVTFTVLPVEDGVTIAADREVLAAVVRNLLQNAFKFTRPRTTVTLRVGASHDRVRIEVEDECGGLASDDGRELFRPFDQRHVDRSGLGLGLAFCRWGAEANQGRIYTRNLPAQGCVFTVDFPRVFTADFPRLSAVDCG